MSETARDTRLVKVYCRPLAVEDVTAHYNRGGWCLTNATGPKHLHGPDQDYMFYGYVLYLRPRFDGQPIPPAYPHGVFATTEERN